MVSNTQMEQLIATQPQAIADAMQQAMQTLIPLIQTGNTGGGGGDPFATRLKSYANTGVEKFNGDGGPVVSMKWIDHAVRMLDMMESVPTEKARRELLSHQLTGNALCWWRTVETSLGPEGLADMTVAQFRRVFEDRFITDASKRIFRDEFRNLRQGEKSVQFYLQKFNELAMFAPRDVEDEQERINLFVDGLRDGLRELVRPQGESTFSAVHNRALQIERDLLKSKSSGARSSGGPFRGSAQFRGGDRARPYDQSYRGGGRGRDFHRGGGRGHFQRGGFQQRNPDQRITQAQPVQQRAPQLALPPPVLAAHGQPQPQPVVRACHRCGDTRHFVRDCPVPRPIYEQRVQQHQPQPQQQQRQQGQQHHGRGGGQGGRVGGRGGTRGGHQQRGGRGGPILAALPGANLEGTLDSPTGLHHVLFDTGSYLSFISHQLVVGYGLGTVPLVPPTTVSTPLGGSANLNEVVRQHPLYLGDRVLYADLIVLGFEGFHYILGMDWMEKNGVTVDTARRTVTIALPGQLPVVVQCQGESVLSTFIFSLEVPEQQLEDVPIVCEFPDVFQEIPGLPPPRVVEFRIDLLPGTAPVSKAAYRMAPKLLDEMKKQLAELIEKG